MNHITQDYIEITTRPYADGQEPRFHVDDIDVLVDNRTGERFSPTTSIGPLLVLEYAYHSTHFHLFLGHAAKLALELNLPLVINGRTYTIEPVGGATEVPPTETPEARVWPKVVAAGAVLAAAGGIGAWFLRR